MRKIILILRDDDPKVHIDEYDVDLVTEKWDFRMPEHPVQIKARITGRTTDGE